MGARDAVLVHDVAVVPHLLHHVRSDPVQVAQRPEVAFAELRALGFRTLVARFDRHRYAAHAEPARRGDQDLRFIYEILARHVAQRRHAGGIEALAALGIGNEEAAAPGDAPVAEFVGEAAIGRLRGALAQACADDDVVGVSVRRRDQARNVGRIVLAVAVHGDDAARAAPQCLGESVAQAGALAHALRMAQHGHRQVGDPLAGAVVGAVVDHDDVGAFAQRGFDHATNAQRLVEGGNHDIDVASIDHQWILTVRARPGPAGSIAVSGISRMPSWASASNSGSIGAIALPPAWRANGPVPRVVPPAPSSTESTGAPARSCRASTSAAPSRPWLGVTCLSGPTEALSKIGRA